MSNNEQLIEKFFRAFAEGNYIKMQQCYHANAHFSDPVFPDLRGNKIKAMWHMLCESGKDLKINYGGFVTEKNSVKANWDAIYTFGKTKRVVHNFVRSIFTIKDGVIIAQRDSFNLWRWSRMALGTPGIFLGWSSLLQGKIKTNASEQLNRFIEKHAAYK